MNEQKKIIDIAFNYYVGKYSMHYLRGREYQSILGNSGVSQQKLNLWLSELEDLGIVGLKRDLNSEFGKDDVVIEIKKEIPHEWLIE